ncbi:MAG: dienelactone hydrolase family protein [Vicinamibacterales bacterium]
MRLPRAIWGALAAVVLATAVTVVALPSLDALAFIVRAAGLPGAAATFAAWRSVPVTRGPRIEVPTRHGPVAGRLYQPARGRIRRAVTLVPGVHMDGIDETRLVGMAEDLAAEGFAVLTVAPPDLQRFRITPASTDVIEDAARWLAGQPALAHDGRVGMLGISFSGGLSIVAAGRPALRDQVAYVLSFGGHGDLPRVMRYLCSGDAPAMPDLGEAREYVTGAEHVTIHPPHDYGVAVVLLGIADRGVVPPGQVEPLRTGILTFLRASSLTLVDRAAAEREFARAREYAATLPEPARTYMTWVNERAVDKLGPVLLPVVIGLGGDPALSPERADPPTAPVFLLHGADDNVIPSVETVLLAAHLHDRTEVHALLSTLITHAEVDRPPTASDLWTLVGFWRALMRI